MNTREFLCELTKKLWRYYILEPTIGNFAKLYDICSQKLVMIGTGKHEFFTDLGHAVADLQKNQVQAQNIKFKIIDEWYEALEITSDVYVVYGGLWAKQLPQNDEETLVEMDTRFSAVFRNNGKRWELIHLHHSIPNFEQGKGEFYPKSIAQQASEAMALVKLFQRRSELDLMTGIYNHESFRSNVQKELDRKGSGVLLLFDIDNFKQFNDTYGHLSGDSLLKLFAKLLSEVFNKNASVGRIGGDEFAVFCNGAHDCDVIAESIKELKRKFSDDAKEIISDAMVGFSVGISYADRQTHPFNEMFNQADKALYKSKSKGKNTYTFFKKCDKV